MVRIERILCPTDLSPEVDSGLAYAIALAQAFEAKLFFFHGLDSVALLEVQSVEAAVRESLISHVGPLQPGLNWEIVVKTGGVEAPATLIVREAAERNADLIVMQSRRRPRAASILGSTAEAVCQTAPCPVLVTHPREHGFLNEESGTISLSRILVADDFSEYSAQALSWGLALAQEFQAALSLMHVLPPRVEIGMPEQEWSKPEANGVVQLADGWLKKNIPEEARLWSRIETVVREGDPGHEILSCAKEQLTDLICLGSHGKGTGWGELLGTNTDRVLRRAPCPVLVARPTWSVKPGRQVGS